MISTTSFIIESSVKELIHMDSPSWLWTYIKINVLFCKSIEFLLSPPASILVLFCSNIMKGRHIWQKISCYSPNMYLPHNIVLCVVSTRGYLYYTRLYIIQCHLTTTNLQSLVALFSTHVSTRYCYNYKYPPVCLCHRCISINYWSLIKINN